MSSNPEQSLEQCGAGWTVMNAGRVRDLAKKFEHRRNSVRSRSPTSYPKSVRRRAYQAKDISEKCAAWPPQKPIRFHLGPLYRKRSTIKKKSKSYLDVSCGSSGVSKQTKRSPDGSMRKSQSNNEYLSDYLRFLGEGALPMQQTTSAENTKILCMQLRSEITTERRRECGAIEQIQADTMYYDRCSSDSSSCVEGGRDCLDVDGSTAEKTVAQQAHSSCSFSPSSSAPSSTSCSNVALRRRGPTGVKPLPPAKPLRLRSVSSSSRRSQDSEDVVPLRPRKLTSPPPILPKSSACKRAIEAARRSQAEDDRRRVRSVSAFCALSPPASDLEEQLTNCYKEEHENGAYHQSEASELLPKCDDFVRQEISNLKSSASDNLGHYFASDSVVNDSEHSPRPSGGSVIAESAVPSNLSSEGTLIAVSDVSVHEQEFETSIQEADIKQSSVESSPKHAIASCNVPNKRSSHSHEEIKKPKVRPPPPPLPTASPRVLRPVQGPQTCAKITHSSDDVTHIEVTANDSSDFCEKMQPFDQNNVTAADGLQQTVCSPRFQRKGFDANLIPKVPSIPPPSPPKLTPPGSADDDEMYEEIEQVISFRDNAMNENEIRQHTPHCGSNNAVSPITNDADAVNSSLPGRDEEEGEEEDEEDDGEEEEEEEEESPYGNYSLATAALSEQLTKSLHFETSNKSEKKKHGFGTLGLRKRSSAVRRPMSTLEFDKLLRIKSDIQLNITKKVGQIKLKVTSASQEKQRRERATSMFYVNQEELRTENSDDMLAQLNFPLDEECIYGDDWSSDDDDDKRYDNESQVTSGEAPIGSRERECSVVQHPVSSLQHSASSSMLSEIERELNLKFVPSQSALPDIIPQSDNGPSCSRECSTSPEEESFEKCKRQSSVPTEGFSLRDGETSKGGYKLRATFTGYETISSPQSSSSEKTFGVPNSNSDYGVHEVDRSIYTPRIIPEPQPLYQIYMMEQQQDALLIENNEHDEGVMLVGEAVDKDLKIRRNSSSASTDSGRGADCSTTVSHITSNTSMRRDRLVAASHFGSQRSLWCELPEVKNSGLLETLSEDAKKLQEAFFEVITSEASYLRSLNILITHFMAAPEMLGSKGTSSVISNEERKHLFSNIFSVRDCSERLLCDLESRLEANLVLTDVCDILSEHFAKNFEPYVKYCSNQVYQDRTLKRLKCENTAFMSCIQRLESDRQCQGLDMRSFLMLPMQRVTRYPLLVIAILDRISADSEQQKTAQMALHYANQVVNSCNEGARRMERTEQLLEIERRLVYKSADLRRIPLVSSGRYLVKRGSLMHLTENRPKSILQTRQQSRSVYIFLFSDILMITKKKLNGTFVCKDYSARRFVDIEPVELDSPKVSPAAVAGLATKPHLFICTLMHNARGKQTELLLSAESESDRERWVSAMRPPTCSNPEEKIYADWDCPQAAAVHNYSAGQEDELSLEKGDMVNILRKMPDGWFYGERVRDGKGGWFPSSYVQQVLNDHVRAKNYRQRLRVIQAAADFRMQQEQFKATSSAARRAPHLMDRFRRLSNPKAFFQSASNLSSSAS